jgi:predicted HTH transcriptional regulator
MQHSAAVGISGGVVYSGPGPYDAFHGVNSVSPTSFSGANLVTRSAAVQAAVFAGTSKRTFLDMKQFKGTAFELLENSETYLKEHMDWRVKFGALEREEVPDIPVDALREALVNSICHRDYRNPKGNEVAIFKDRVEIYNPGTFPPGHSGDSYRYSS